jgi:thiamine pyrophosphate-dependent acetolactate synthase large subunit-like protein
MEVWDQIKGMDYTLAGTSVATPATWARRLWDMNKAHNHTGGSGAAGVGYGLPAAVGAALANRGSERITVNFQPDGDFLYAPGALWTAAHHRIPLLTIMHNNRSYHQERMHLQLMANRHNRGIDRTGIGVDIDKPHIDFSQMAKSMGVYAEGPISQPGDLRDAIARALAVVRKGEPALLDVECQAR